MAAVRLCMDTTWSASWWKASVMEPCMQYSPPDRPLAKPSSHSVRPEYYPLCTKNQTPDVKWTLNTHRSQSWGFFPAELLGVSENFGRKKVNGGVSSRCRWEEVMKTTWHRADSSQLSGWALKAKSTNNNTALTWIIAPPSFHIHTPTALRQQRAISMGFAEKIRPKAEDPCT